jgi:polysaccharide export outer membrane protein
MEVPSDMKYARTLAALTALAAGIWLSVAADGQEYPLKPRDTIGLHVWNEPNLTLGSLVIDPQGYVRFPLIGRVKAAGKTLSELTDELTAAFSEYVKNPLVTLIMVDFDLPRVTVLGRGVNRPGQFRMKEGSTVADAVAAAGATTSFADLKNATLTRSGSDVPIPIDLDLLEKGDMSQNLLLYDGDLIIVPEDLLNRYYVVGRVARPGVFPLRDDARTVIDAIANASWEQARGDLRRVYLIRGYPDNPEKMEINVDELFQTGAVPPAEYYLQEGDIVYVPEKPGVDWNEVARQTSVLSSTAYLLRLFDIINP